MNAEAEISNLKFRLDMLEQQLQKAVAENSALKKQHEEDQKTILKLQQENRNLHDSVDYLTRKLYGSSSEKTSALKGQIPGQLSLFDEAETEADPEKKEPDLKEAVKGKRLISAWVPPIKKIPYNNSTRFFYGFALAKA